MSGTTGLPIPAALTARKEPSADQPARRSTLKTCAVVPCPLSTKPALTGPPRGCVDVDNSGGVIVLRLSGWPRPPSPRCRRGSPRAALAMRPPREPDQPAARALRECFAVLLVGLLVGVFWNRQCLQRFLRCSQQ